MSITILLILGGLILTGGIGFIVEGVGFLTSILAFFKNAISYVTLSFSRVREFLILLYNDNVIVFALVLALTIYGAIMLVKNLIKGRRQLNVYDKN